ncbi:hypothetical protein ACQ8AN_000044 [Acinetobacter baumannii]|uniref:hypothetical protein n=1 Tax=Acinetobacter calcoaceticus/baumannii complex TaxID=909768 RepID=UPI001A9B9E17|nr:hypothetical protein [Acinetobacter nosocomialis]MBO1281859.1 hypothetical protein [Acinetobacter nosocomialis]MDO7480725.1 hypothetical protein [Acinetobacter baumannii]
MASKPTPHDLIAASDRMRKYTENFILDPEKWKSFRPIANLDWHQVKFENSSKDSVPSQRGIYAFVLKMFSNSTEESNFPCNGYILYGGITTRTLKNRFGEYLRESGKRLRIFQMINNWEGNLYFYYSEIPDTSIDLKVLEKQFNNTVMPPFSQFDFSADIKLAKSCAFG